MTWFFGIIVVGGCLLAMSHTLFIILIHPVCVCCVSCLCLASYCRAPVRPQGPPCAGGVVYNKEPAWPVAGCVGVLFQ